LTINRNFGAKDYEKLAAYLGLCNQMLANWDFRNPNSTAANDFHIKFLSKHPSLTIQSEYSGDPSSIPTLARSSGLTSFRGMDYYEYKLTWTGGSGVPAGGKFHTGISFMEKNDFVVRDTFLTQNGSQMPLKPRIPSRTADAKLDGRFTIQMLNSSDAGMTLKDLRIRMLLKMADLERMLPTPIDEPMTTDGELITPLADLRFPAPFELPPIAIPKSLLIRLPIGWRADRTLLARSVASTIV
jgi:hypothetical protein